MFRYTPIITAVAVLTLASVARSQAPTTQPAETAPPAEPTIIRADDAESPPPPVAFMGITVNDLTAEQTEAAGLPQGVGLQLSYVVPHGPADKAGLIQGDVLHMANDQILVNGPQLQVLVRMHDPGDQIVMRVLRDGKIEQVPVELGKWEPRKHVVHFENPEMQFDQQGGVRVAADKLTLRYRDGEYLISYTKGADGEHLTCNTLEGETVFDGPIDSAEQREQLPDDLRQRVDKIHETLKRQRVQVRPAPDASEEAGAEVEPESNGSAE